MSRGGLHSCESRADEKKDGDYYDGQDQGGDAKFGLRLTSLVRAISFSIIHGETLTWKPLESSLTRYFLSYYRGSVARLAENLQIEGVVKRKDQGMCPDFVAVPRTRIELVTP